MADDNSLTKHLMNLQEQVTRFAAAKKHTHLTEHITDASQKLATKNHADTNGAFGVATSEEYGHVKVDSSIKTDSTNPVQNKVIAKQITDAITNLKTELEGKLQSKINIVKTVTSSSTDNDIPTAKAVWSALTSYEDLLTGVSLSRPKKTTTTIDYIVQAGYYQVTKPGVFFSCYGDNVEGSKVFYSNGFVRVEAIDDRVIQHVYATEPVVSNNQTYYKLNGHEYTRYGIGYVSVGTDGSAETKMQWEEWHVAHIPYKSISSVKSSGPNIDEKSIQIFENTAGFIFHWDQNATDDDRYTITAPLYEYEEICTFGKELPIRGPYVFGNLIGRMDIKITSTGMWIRSNVQPGGRIIEVHETFFVPRNR